MWVLVVSQKLMKIRGSSMPFVYFPISLRTTTYFNLSNSVDIVVIQFKLVRYTRAICLDNRCRRGDSRRNLLLEDIPTGPNYLLFRIDLLKRVSSTALTEFSQRIWADDRQVRLLLVEPFQVDLHFSGSWIEFQRGLRHFRPLFALRKINSSSNSNFSFNWYFKFHR